MLRPLLRHTAVAVCAALGLGAALALAGPAQADPAPCAVSPILVNPCRPWIGTSAANYPGVGSGTQNQVAYHEQRLGRQLDIVHTYHPVGTDSLTPDDVYYATRPNTMLFANWKPTANWADVASHDAGIDQMAASIKALGTHRIFLTLFHEPEKSVSPHGDPNCPNVAYKGGSGTAADYRAMWRYVENRFAADGVNNVVWVLDYMNYPTWDCLVPDLYPGDQYIDWVTFNAYQQTATQTFAQNVGHFTDLLRADTDASHSYTSKPWGIAELGTHGFSVAQEEAFYDSAKSALDAHALANIDLYMAFDENDQASATGDNYRVGYDDNGTVDPVKGAHYYAFADDPLLTGGYQAPPPPPDITPPTATITSPADGASVAGQVTITGTAADDRSLAGVRLLVDGADAGPATFTADGGVSDGWDTTTAGNGTHTLQWQASDAAGNTAVSAAVTVTVANDVTAPSSPAVQATVDGPDQVTLGWTASSDDTGVTGYRVYRNGNRIAALDGGTTQYVDTGLTDATSYEYTVDAVDAAGNASDPSAPADVTTPDATAPTAPSGLTATATGPHEIDLDWTAASDNVGVTGYDVYRDGQVVATVDGATTRYADTGLADLSNYTYTVDAVDAAGNTSAATDPAVASTPDGTAPTQPTGLTATVTGPHEIDLTWSAASDNVGVTGYDVHRDGQLIATVTDPGYADTGLTDASEYSYTVDAVDAAGNTSAASEPASASTPDGTAPTDPDGLAAAVAGPHEIDLAWQPATDNVAVTGYQVYRDGQPIATVTDPAYADTGLPDGSAYNYAVVALDAAGNASEGDDSATASLPDVTAPGPPTGLIATAAGGTEIDLAWTAATDNVGVAGYEVARDGAGIAYVTADSTGYRDTGLAEASPHTYTVTAVDAAGNTSGASDPATAATPDVTAPRAPRNLTVGAVAPSGVRLTWTAATDNVGVTGYQVFRNGVLFTTIAPATAYTDQSTVATRNYRYSVVAVDAAGNASPHTTTLTIVPPDLVPPTAPATVTATLTATRAVQVRWAAGTDNLAVAGYLVLRDGVQVAVAAPGSRAYTDSTVAQGATHTYAVLAYDAAGNVSGAGPTPSVRVPDVTAPSAPTALVLVPGRKLITLTWAPSTDNVAVTHYAVFRDGTRIATVTGPTEFVNRSLISGTSYSYDVVAYDAPGNASPPSALVSAVAG